ncbi:FKBP-type peptidyl-prolyl cis-trans isomerase [Luteimonas sp. MHLX1A]|uniref:FKBP-type peptidyl-prolyl cis-trans isomerase n=1 Tax=Alterluteimonas muca TaxID=2878684 RepID=UPI001E379C98|nr:peptidylprolyl isomerase [Luteimonas sp. MHLX1A]MCD9046984.1 peptidylprolyl isomerase [Luteimonas sp. MHLX1A]
MEIAAERVVSFHYTLTDDAGAVIDRSPDDRPLSYLHGAGNIVPGLENALAGHAVGDQLTVDVEPELGYGVRHEGLVQSVPKQAFQGVDNVQLGMQFRAQTEGGSLLVTVVEVGDDEVRVDGNHPLAGKTLHFDVRIASVRAATDEEKQNGQAMDAG